MRKRRCHSFSALNRKKVRDGERWGEAKTNRTENPTECRGEKKALVIFKMKMGRELWGVRWF